MAEVDTSSYPKPAALPVQKSALDQVGQYQQLESGKLGIDQQKLKLMNEQFGLINNELSTLIATPNVTKEQAAVKLQTFANTYKLPPQVVQHMMGELQAAPDVKSFAQNALTRGQTTQERINFQYGIPGTINNEQQQIPIQSSPKFGIQRLDNGTINQPIQRQIPPTTVIPGVGPNAPDQLLGPQPEVPAPQARSQLPIKQDAIPGQSNIFGGDVTGAEVMPSLPVAAFNNRFDGGPTGPVSGRSPMFEEGKKALIADQASSTERMMQAKPAIQALPLMQSKGFLAGPGSEQFTNVVAALKTAGIIDTAAENDPTAIRQEVSKKLAQYVSSSPVGQRSDAAQTLKEASSPNPKVQILPALIRLTKDAVALDRVEAARANSFDTNKQDLSTYGSHRANFPQSIDENAFALDLEPDNGASIVDDMAKKLNSKNVRERASADKFFRSLKIAKAQGFYQ